MLIIRRVLQAIFILIGILLIITFVVTANPDYGQFASFALLITFIILLLGPMWPSKEKMENLKVNLYTDNPKLAVPLFMVGIALVSFYFALSEWMSPSQSHSRWVKTAYSLFGSPGVVAFWSLLGVFCLISAYNAYKKIRTA